MGKLYEVGKIRVSVYADDHLPPHFHVRTPDEEALILIADLTLYSGSMTPATRRRVWTWIVANVAAIAAEWNRVNPRFPIA